MVRDKYAVQEAPAPRAKQRRYLLWLWQACLQVCAWLSQALTQGLRSVVGQMRWQDASWVAQLARQASEVASATRSLARLKFSLARAGAKAIETSRTIPSVCFIVASENRLFVLALKPGAGGTACDRLRHCE